MRTAMMFTHSMMRTEDDSDEDYQADKEEYDEEEDDEEEPFISQSAGK